MITLLLSEEGGLLTELNLKLLRKRRLEQHITLQQCAKALGLSQSGPYLLKEQGKRNFKVNEVPIICKLLNLTIEEVYTK